MEPRKNTHSRKKGYRNRNPLKRLFFVTLSVLVMLSGGIFWAEAETIQTPTFKLQAFGPIDEDNGFPVWYKDDSNTRLQLCLDLNDPLCALIPEEIPRPDEPISLKNNNFPEEAFYQLASSVIDLPNGGRAVGTFALEASWANGIPQDGDQIVFGRVRFRIDGLVTGKTYTITHPYGVDRLVATAADKKNPDNGEIRFVEDIGTTGGFQASMKSRIGRFLKWDTDKPDGYIGDPNQDHTITGGFNDQNFFRVEGEGVGDSACGTNCMETKLFSVMGKEATTSGVDVVRATYSLTDKNGGTIDVFAYTETDRKDGYELDVSTELPGNQPVRMKGANGKYFARIPFETSDPPHINVVNLTDKPNTFKKNILPVDKITGKATASYNPDTGNFTLIVQAESSDTVNQPELTVDGFDGTINGGKLAISTSNIPANILIKSSKGGRVTVPVDISGDSFVPLVANAGAAKTYNVGDTVTLDGSQSIGVGANTKIEWIPISPLTLPADFTLTDPLKPTFTATKGMGVLEFLLKLTNPDGVVSTSNVKVTIKEVAAPAPVANAGPDQINVTQNQTVTLDGSGSLNAIEYTWTQVDEPNVPKVTINSPDSAHPTFTFPKKFTPLKFKLQVKGQDGSIVEDDVLITPAPDKLTVAAPAEYRTRTGEWRIDGTSTVSGPGVTVTIYLVDPNKIVKEIGKADVDTIVPLGAFRFRGPGPSFVAGSTLKIVSSSGGVLENVSIVRK